MELSLAQKQEFLEKGYVKLAGLVSRERIDVALRAINHSLGERGINPVEMPRFRAQGYTPELEDDPAILALLYETGLWEAVESLVGEEKIQRVPKGQVILRFPVPRDGAPYQRPHLDGVHSPTNGVPAGMIRSHTALASVLLNDITAGGHGNLTLWPGSHHANARYFREHTPLALLDGMPPLDYGAPVQVIGEAGDVIIFHYLLSHASGKNFGVNIRYGVNFRFDRVDHDALGSMTDAWQEYDGMQSLVSAELS